jgi:hypothetical protein
LNTSHDNPPIVGLSGKAGAGKDTLAELLVKTGRYTRMAFADALKQDVATMLYGNPAPGNIARLNADKRGIPEVRSLLQSYGVARRALQPDYWVDRLFNEWDRYLYFSRKGTGLYICGENGDIATPPSRLVVPDVRFVNEADAIKERSGVIIRVHRPRFDNGLTEEQKLHPSETELDTYSFDYRVFNAGPPERMLEFLEFVTQGRV